ncbi:MAG TPA: hypothetical protein VFC63_16315 [Blastocatellia bacterium]|nr:hypothetical protein [Blastocatellia bacterium]
MRFLAVLYISSFFALGGCLYAGFSLQTYEVCVKHDSLVRRANAEDLYNLPSTTDFIGTGNLENLKAVAPHAIRELVEHPLDFIAALYSDMPLMLQAASLLMLSSVLACAMLRPKLRQIRKLRNSFEPLTVIGIAYLLNLAGYVFTWVDYNCLLASTIGRDNSVPYSAGPGVTIVEDAFARVSVGSLISAFGIVLVSGILVDAIRIYREWKKSEWVADCIPSQNPVYRLTFGNASKGRLAISRRANSKSQTVFPRPPRHCENLSACVNYPIGPMAQSQKEKQFEVKESEHRVLWSAERTGTSITPNQKRRRAV